MSSTITDSIPRFKMVACVATTFFPVSCLEGASAFFSAEFADLAETIGCHADLLPTFHDMRCLSVVLENLNKMPKTSVMEMVSFSKMRSAVEHRLLSLPKKFQTVDGKVRLDYDYQACRTAILIFTNHVFRTFDPKVAILKILKKRLMGLIQCKEDTAEVTDDSSTAGRMLWILCLGGLLSLDHDERTWFASRIAKGSLEMRVTSWTEMQEHLMKYLWVPRLYNKECRLLWEEAQRLQGA